MKERCWGLVRFQAPAHRAKKIAVVEGQVRQALLWNESLDSDVVLSMAAALALTVVSCERSPIASWELMVTSAAEVSSTPSRTCDWNPGFAMRREYVPVGKPAKRYSPAVSVSVLRFNPVPWLTIVTTTPETTAPLGSVMAPETVASWVCDHATTERSAGQSC